MAVVALRSHRCVRAGTVLGGPGPCLPPSTPSTLPLFGAELPTSSTAPGTHGSDFGEAGEEVVGTLIANSSLLATSLGWDPAPLLPTSSSSRSFPRARSTERRLPELTGGFSSPSELETEVVSSILAWGSHQCPAWRHGSPLSPPWGRSQPVLQPGLFPALFLSLCNCFFPSVVSGCGGFKLEEGGFRLDTGKNSLL